jgi:hypothetical protein
MLLIKISKILFTFLTKSDKIFTINDKINMSTISHSLNRGQESFLRDNFVVFDPLSQKCHMDFSRIPESKVILIGEIHGSSIFNVFSLSGMANEIIYIENIPADAFHKLSSQLAREDYSQKQFIIFHYILNTIFMLSHKRVSSYATQGTLKCYPKVKNKRPSLMFFCTQDFEIKFSKENEMIGRLDYLLIELKRNNISEFSLSPNETILFLDITENEALALVQNPQTFSDWIKAKSPFATHWEISGDFALSFVKTKPFNSYPEALPALLLTTQTGFKFKLVS